MLRHRALDNILLDCYSWPLDHNQWTDTAHDSIFFFIFSTSSPPNRTGSVQFRASISRQKPQDFPRDAPAVGAALNFFSHWPNFDLAPRVRGQWNDWRRTRIMWSNFIIDNGVYVLLFRSKVWRTFHYNTTLLLSLLLTATSKACNRRSCSRYQSN